MTTTLTEADARWYLTGNQFTTDQADTVIRTMNQLHIPLTSAEVRQTAIDLFGHSL